MTNGKLTGPYKAFFALVVATFAYFLGWSLITKQTKNKKIKTQKEREKERKEPRLD